MAFQSNTQTNNNNLPPTITSPSSSNMSKLEALQTCLTQLNADYEKLSILYGNTLTKNTKQISDMQSHLSQTTSSLNDLISTNQQLKSQIISLESKNASLTSTLSSIQKKLTNIKCLHQKADTTNRKLQNEVTIKNERYQVIKDMNEKLELKAKKILHQMESVLQIEEKAEEYEKEKEKYESCIKELEEELKELNEVNGGLRRKNVELENEVERCRGDIADMKMKIIMMKGESNAEWDEEEGNAEDNEYVNMNSNMKYRMNVNVKFGDDVNVDEEKEKMKKQFFSASLNNYVRDNHNYGYVGNRDNDD